MASPSTLLILRELVAELRGLRADLRRSREVAAPELREALADEFGDGRFTTSGILSLADEDPHGALARALASSIDMNASPRSRATALGAVLVRLPQIEVVAQQRGCAVFRLRTSPPEVRKVHGDVR